MPLGNQPLNAFINTCASIRLSLSPPLPMPTPEEGGPDQSRYQADPSQPAHAHAHTSGMVQEWACGLTQPNTHNCLLLECKRKVPPVSIELEQRGLRSCWNQELRGPPAGAQLPPVQLGPGQQRGRSLFLACLWAALNTVPAGEGQRAKAQTRCGDQAAQVSAELSGSASVAGARRPWASLRCHRGSSVPFWFDLCPQAIF